MDIKPVAIVAATLGMTVKAWIALSVFLFLWDLYQLQKEEKK